MEKNPGIVAAIARVLAASQAYMRKREVNLNELHISIVISE